MSRFCIQCPTFPPRAVSSLSIFSPCIPTFTKRVKRCPAALRLCVSISFGNVPLRWPMSHSSGIAWHTFRVRSAGCSANRARCDGPGCLFARSARIWGTGPNFAGKTSGTNPLEPAEIRTSPHILGEPLRGLMIERVCDICLTSRFAFCIKPRNRFTARVCTKKS
jgi:hypothetical protein